MDLFWVVFSSQSSSRLMDSIFFKSVAVWRRASIKARSQLGCSLQPNRIHSRPISRSLWWILSSIDGLLCIMYYVLCIMDLGLMEKKRERVLGLDSNGFCWPVNGVGCINAPVDNGVVIAAIRSVAMNNDNCRVLRGQLWMNNTIESMRALWDWGMAPRLASHRPSNDDRRSNDDRLGWGNNWQPAATPAARVDYPSSTRITEWHWLAISYGLACLWAGLKVDDGWVDRWRIHHPSSAHWFQIREIHPRVIHQRLIERCISNWISNWLVVANSMTDQFSWASIVTAVMILIIFHLKSQLLGFNWVDSFDVFDEGGQRPVVSSSLQRLQWQLRFRLELSSMGERWTLKPDDLFMAASPWCSQLAASTWAPHLIELVLAWLTRLTTAGR